MFKNICISTESLFSLKEKNLSELPLLPTTDKNCSRIYLIRHGESLYNAWATQGNQLISGNSLDIPLTEKGVKEALNTGKVFTNKFSASLSFVIVSSSAVRAKETARYIYEEMCLSHQVIRGECFEEFLEIGHGAWEGKPRDAIYDEAYKKWKGLSAKDKFSQVRLETGETYEDASIRYSRGVEHLLAAYPDDTLILVSHNAAMNAYILALTGQVEHLSSEEGTDMPLVKINNVDMLLLEKKKRDSHPIKVKFLLRQN